MGGGVPPMLTADKIICRCGRVSWQRSEAPELPSSRTTTERSHPRDPCSRAFVHVRAIEGRQAAGACLYVAVESRASVFPGGMGMSVSGGLRARLGRRRLRVAGRVAGAW
jgi:hypothetical protein